jgi:type III restriction enzyme
MRTCWVPGVNNLGKYGRWAFAEFRRVFEIDSGFDKLMQAVSANKTQPQRP